MRTGILALVLAAAVTGCTPDSSREAQLEDYLERVSRTVDTETPPWKQDSPPAINSADLGPVQVPEGQIGLLDFLSLSGCDLQRNLGRRNSALGRSASPSQRLLLDLEFLDLAPACILSIGADDPELATQLAGMAQQRRDALPRQIYNAVLGGTEWRQFWRLPRTLEDYPRNTNGDVADALNRLADLVEQWLESDWQTDGQSFELLLSALRTGDGGHLLLAAHSQEHTLQRASASIEDRLRRRPLCPFGGDTETSTTLRNVATQFFAADLQPWLAALRRREALLMTPIRRLEIALEEALPERYEDWQARRDRQLSALSNAPRAHAEQISLALEPCGGVRAGSR